MDEQPEADHYTIVVWPAGDGYHAFIPAFEIALPEASSIGEMLESARAFLTEQASLQDFAGTELPPDVELIVETVEARTDEQLRMPAELFMAALTAAFGDVVTALSDNREAVSVLLDTLTSMAILLVSGEPSPFEPPAIWSEEEIHATVGETLDQRMETSELTAAERDNLREQLRDLLDRQFAVARDLDLA